MAYESRRALKKSRDLHKRWHEESVRENDKLRKSLNDLTELAAKYADMLGVERLKGERYGRQSHFPQTRADANRRFVLRLAGVYRVYRERRNAKIKISDLKKELGL